VKYITRFHPFMQEIFASLISWYNVEKKEKELDFNDTATSLRWASRHDLIA